jgi:hypothetical protein
MAQRELGGADIPVQNQGNETFKQNLCARRDGVGLRVVRHDRKAARLVAGS